MKNSDYCIFLRERNRQNLAGFPTKFAECLTTGIGVVVNDISDIGKYFPIENSILIKDSVKILSKYVSSGECPQDKIARLQQAIDNGNEILSTSSPMKLNVWE